MLDVALVASELLERRPADATSFGADVGLDQSQARAWLTVLAGLHDIGKATPVFQAAWPEGAPPEALGRVYAPLPHGLATAVLLNPWLRDAGCSRRVSATLAHAVGMHHGWVATEDQLAFGAYDPRSIGEDEAPWSSWRDRLCADVRHAFGATDVPLAKRIPATRTWARVAGLTAVADWIGSGLPHRGRVDDVPSYLAERGPDVQARLQEVGWAPTGPWWVPPTGPGFGAWFDEPIASDPRPLQVAVERTFASDAAAPRLVIIEAPMGEGKTEAAFYAIVSSGRDLGAYYALPTQATSDAMAERLRSFVDRHKRRDVRLALAHGGARVAASAGVVSRDREGAAADATAAAWFSSGRRELLAELGVGTVDQALLGVLPTKHHFVRLWALAGRVVVIDEVHAYDAYTGTLVESLVEWAGALECTIVLMSATLPSGVCARLIAAYARGLGVEASPMPTAAYPRLTTVDGAGGSARTEFRASRASKLRVEPVSHDIDALTAEILSAADPDAAVGVVVNTVDRAQELYLRLRDGPCEVLLLHARLPKAERSRREQSLLHRFGPSSVSAQRGAIVVGTQVIEQSLDLDFDVLFTDLAPIDLMLQRAGRLHRHAGRERPLQHVSPILHVAGFGRSRDVGPDAAAVDTVYDAHVLWRSWAALTAAGGLVNMPGDLDRLVQAVYADEPLPALEPYAERAANDQRLYVQRMQTAVAAARGWAIPAPMRAATEGWTTTASDEMAAAPWQLRAPTRLGEDVATVVPVTVDRAGWLVAGDPNAMPTTARRAPESWVRCALEQQVRVSRQSVLRALRGRPTPAWWSVAGPLRYMAPLELDKEGRWLVDPSVRLDAELGLVYGPRAERATT